MTRPILRLATRVDRRTRWTAWAIAFACMVLVGSLNLVDGLSAGVDAVTSRFSSGPTLYLHGNDLLASAIDENALVSLPVDYAVLRAHPGTIAVAAVTRAVIVASLTEYHAGNASVPFPAGSRDIAIDSGLVSELQNATGSPLGTAANLSVFALAAQAFKIAPPPSARPALFPDDWVWVRPELLIALDPMRGGPAQAVLTPSPLDPATAANLGLTPLQTAGAIGFTQASIAEARSVLLGLAAVLAVVIGLLAYGAIGIEVQLRQEEIRTLRSLGAPPSTVAAVYEGHALVLALLGATLGSSLGVVLAHAIVSFAPLIGFANLILLPLPGIPVLLAYGLAVGAAVVGGVPPTRHALRIVRSAREVRPS